MPINIEQMENQVAEVSVEFEDIDPLIIEYSTTNVIVQAVNIAETTFAISGPAFASEQMPETTRATTPMPTTSTPPPTMTSGY